MYDKYNLIYKQAQCTKQRVLWLVTKDPLAVKQYETAYYIFGENDTELSPFHTSCECECVTNFDVTNSQVIVEHQ